MKPSHIKLAWVDTYEAYARMFQIFGNKKQYNSDPLKIIKVLSTPKLIFKLRYVGNDISQLFNDLDRSIYISLCHRKDYNLFDDIDLNVNEVVTDDNTNGI